MTILESLSGDYEPEKKDHRYKLEPVDVLAIRRRYAMDPKPTQKALAREFGVTQPQISKIVNKKRWKD